VSSGRTVFLRKSGLLAALTSVTASTLLAACGSSAPQGCADIERAMTPYWEAVAEWRSYKDAGNEPPSTWASRMQSAQSNAIRDLQKISSREVGEVANVADLLSASIDNPDSASAQDAGVAGYMLLKSECNVEPPY
jgi:hypothetical protein